MTPDRLRRRLVRALGALPRAQRLAVIGLVAHDRTAGEVARRYGLKNARYLYQARDAGLAKLRQAFHV